MGSKVYDQAYFDQWYRNPRFAVVNREVLRRRVALALCAAEYLLERPVRTVLDVGCGEGAWRAELRRLRPGVRYLGLDTSDYALQRHGTRRNLRRGSVGDFAELNLRGPYDLIVCSDVLHYVETPELRRGLREMSALLGGVAFLEFFCAEDDVEGDRAGLMPRSAAEYQRLLRAAGLYPVGLHCYVGREVHAGLTKFERAWR